MKWPRPLRGRLKLLLPLLLAVCLAVPFVRADRYRDPIRGALRQALNREVEINGPVRLMLFPQPGFSISRVIIYDDPSIGLEPLAYVPSLDIGVRLSSLLRRRLEFSRLSLNEPKVNLVKSDGGSWNYPPLLDRAFGATRHGRAPLPEIRVRSGRLNFKFGLTKSIFYFANADVDVSPSANEEAAVRIRFSGEPARTDRPGGGFSTLSGAGVLTFPPDGRNQVAVSLRMERSAISEMLGLLRGRGMDLAGFIASNARLEGEMSAIRITGSLELADVDERFLLGAQQNNSAIKYRGLLDLQSQRLVLENIPGQLPISIRFRASDYLTQVRWALVAALRELPLNSLPDLARETGTHVPEGLSLSGSLSGAFSLSSRGELKGQLGLQNAEVKFADAETLALTEGFLLLDDRLVRLKPAIVSVGERDSARVELVYDPYSQALDVGLDAASLSIPAFVALWNRFTNLPVTDFFSSFRSGSMQGQLRYASKRETDGAWNGKFTLTDAVVPVDGLQKPVVIASAAATLKASSIQLRSIKAQAGGIDFSGDYGYSELPAHPHRLDLHFTKLEAPALERLLGPALLRPRQGFLARTLRFPPPTAPAWLGARRAEGRFRIDELIAGPVRLSAADARFHWRGLTAEIDGLKSECNEGLLSGNIAIDLRNAVPRYKAELQLQGLPWEGGELDLEGALNTSGLGAQLLANLNARGSFSSRSTATALLNIWDSALGSFEISVARGAPVLALTSLEVVRGSDTYSGTGRTASAGHLELLLSNESEQLGMSGTLFPLRLQAKSKTIR